MEFSIKMNQGDLSKLLKLFNVNFPNTKYEIKGYDGDMAIVEVKSPEEDYELFETLMEEFEHSIDISENIFIDKKYIGKYEGDTMELLSQILKDFDGDKVKIIVERL
jgi:hypothetical protein